MSEASSRFATAFGEALRAGAGVLGLTEVVLCHQERFTALALAVHAANEAAGLTTIEDPADVAIKHFLDSLVCLRSGAWRGARTAVDVGSGGGFPGLALAVALPEVEFTLVEASAKKAAFLTRASEAVGRRTTVRHVRAEDFGREVDGPGRDRFDVGLARATAPLAVSCEYVLPLVRPGGHYLAQVGPRVGRRLAAFRGQGVGDDEPSPPWRVLGGELVGVAQVALPAGRGARYLAEFAKVAPTPPKYPRRAGTPSRSPLRGFHV